MISLLIPGIFVVLFAILTLVFWDDRQHDVDIVFLTFASIAILVFGLVAILVPTSSKAVQFADSENVKRVDAVIEINEIRAEDLLTDFSYALVQLYPEHEAQIFEDIARYEGSSSLDGIDVYAVKYPEIRASETLMAYIAQARSIKDEIYNLMAEKEAILAAMRYRQVNPWLFGVPKIATE